MQYLKQRRPLDATTPGAKIFHHFSLSGNKNPVARKFLQFSYNGLAPEVYNACLSQI